MSDFLAANSTLVLIQAFILLALAVVVTPLIVALVQWRMVRHAEIEASMHRTEIEAGLKREMLGRGMSAADIRQVLEAHAERASEAAAARAAEAKEHLRKKWAAFGRVWAACANRRYRRCDGPV